MSISDFSAVILAACAALGVITALGAWAVRATMRPFKEILRQNTEALKGINELVKSMDTRVDNHENRLVKVETTHQLNGCNVPRRRIDDIDYVD